MPAMASGVSSRTTFGRRPEDQRVVGEHLAFGDDGTGTDQAVAADHRAVEHHCLDAHQRAIADGAAMQHGLVDQW